MGGGEQRLTMLDVRFPGGERGEDEEDERVPDSVGQMGQFGWFGPVVGLLFFFSSFLLFSVYL
jgi:hypothetical protein